MLEPFDPNAWSGSHEPNKSTNLPPKGQVVANGTTAYSKWPNEQRPQRGHESSAGPRSENALLNHATPLRGLSAALPALPIETRVSPDLIFTAAVLGKNFPEASH